MTTTVGVNLLFIRPYQNRGTLTYIRSVLMEMEKHHDVELVLFLTRDNSTLFTNLHHARSVICSFTGSGRLQRILYEQLQLPGKATREGCDVLFCPGYLAPTTKSLPVVVTIHDMQYRDVPETTSLAARTVYRLLLPRGARAAHSIIAVSEFSKTRIVKLLDVPPERVFVTLEAPMMSTMVHEPGNTDVLARYSIERDYVLSVSTNAAHKNVPRLIEAYLRFRHRTSQPFDMVLVGHLSDDLQRRFAGKVGDGLRFLGYVPDADLALLYRRATAFALASYYEGFGLPVVEAMQMGVPVACSNSASLPEVAGGAAVLFDPFDVASITDALSKVTLDRSLRERLKIAGPEQAATFSWERCAGETLRILRNAAGEPSRGNTPVAD